MPTVKIVTSLDDVAEITGRSIDTREMEIRCDCPLCGRGSKTATKLRISEGDFGRLFAWCYACNAKSQAILKALGVDANSRVSDSTERRQRRDAEGKDKPLPGLIAPDNAKPNLRPLSWEEVQQYLKAIRTVGHTGFMRYGSIDGRLAAHRRLATAPEPGEKKLGKKPTSEGLKGHGWYPRKWLPEKLPPRGTPEFFTEGEADAAKIAEMGYVAWSAPGGANRWQSLALNDVISSVGRTTPLIVIQDNDAPGYAMAQNIVPTFKLKNVQVFWPNPSQVAHGDSLADDPVRIRELARTNRCLGYDGFPHKYDDLVWTVKKAGYNAPEPPSNEIPRMERPSDRQCRSCYALSGEAAPDHAKGNTQNLRMPVDCRRCKECGEWHVDEVSLLWTAAEPVPGQQTVVRFLGLDSVEDVRKALVAQQRRKGGCKGQPAYHVTVKNRHIAVDEDSAETFTYDALVFYLHPLPEQAIANTRAWAADPDNAVHCVIDENYTVTRDDFANALVETGMIRGEDGRGKRRGGFWKWPVKYKKPEPPTYILGKYTAYVHIPGEIGAMEVQGTDDALERLDDTSKDREQGAWMNARDWMKYVSISEELWLELVVSVETGRGMIEIPGYHGPVRLLRDAVNAWLHKTPTRKAFYAVWDRIGKPPVTRPPQPEPTYISPVAFGLHILGKNLAESERTGQPVQLSPSPVEATHSPIQAPHRPSTAEQAHQGPYVDYDDYEPLYDDYPPTGIYGVSQPDYT